MIRSLLPAALAWALLPAAAAAMTSGELDERLAEVDELLAARDFASAETAARDLLAEAETSFGEDAVTVGRVLNRLVDSRLGQRAADEECLAMAERAVRITETSAGGDGPETAESLRRLGMTLQARQRFQDAAPPLERALAIQEGRFGRGSTEAAEVLGRLAFLYRDLHREVEAAAMLEETIETQERADATSEDIAPLIYNLAVLRMGLGELDVAERLYERLLEITPTGKGRERSVAWNGLAMVRVELGRYAEAEEAFDRAISAAREAGAHPGMTAYYLHNLGFLLSELGAYADAARTFTEVLALRRELYGDEHVETAATLANLADAYLAQGDAETASRYHEEALQTRERLLGADHEETATSLRKLAIAYRELGRNAEAHTLLIRGLEIRTGNLGPSNHDTAEMMTDLARSEVALGMLDDAGSHFRTAMGVFEKTVGSSSPDWNEACLGLAAARALQGKPDEAWSLALQAEAGSREHTRLTASALPERQALRYAAVNKRALDLVLALASVRKEPEDTRTAWDRVTRSRALVLDVVAARRARIHRDASSETRELREEYDAASRELASQLIAGGDGEDAIRNARERQERAERRLAARSEEFRRARDRTIAGLQEVAAARPEGSAILSFVRYTHPDLAGRGSGGDRYLAFALPADSGTPSLLELGAAARIDELVTLWRAQTQPRRPETSTALYRYRRAGGDLRAALWDPAAKALDGAAVVFIIPDGAIHRVSLAAMPTEPSGYLLDEIPIQYLSAERDLAAGDRDSAPGHGLLAVGEVEFGRPGESVATGSRLDGVTFEPLPGTGSEVRTIAELWRNRSQASAAQDDPLVLTGPEASEAAFLKSAPGRRIVHLATHGFFLEPGVRGTVATSTRAIGGMSARRRPGDAETLAGLALAGANVRGDDPDRGDGILTAEEIATMNLAGTEWVVLSACDTGLGELQTGEGVLGLRRAFEVSGAHTLVMSLWDVDDEATTRWMKTLYEKRLGEGLPTTRALVEASKQTRDWCRDRYGTDHPFYWGAFVAAGDWR